MWYFLLEVLDCVPLFKAGPRCQAANLCCMKAVISIKATVFDVNVVTGKVNESIGNKTGRKNCSIDRVY